MSLAAALLHNLGIWSIFLLPLVVLKVAEILSMKVSISLPDELVRYIDQRVENRSRLVEVLLQPRRKQQEQQAMIEACLLLDELSDELTDEDEAWQQAAITDWEASGL